MNGSYFGGCLLLAGLLSSGCSSDRATGEGAEHTGSLRLGLAGLRATHDVGTIRYVVVLQGQSCTDTPLAETTVPLEEEPFPTALLPDGGGGGHPFGDALFVLAPGLYTVCATPLTANGGPSAECPRAAANAFVGEGATTEVGLVSQCKGVNNGALDAFTILNSPPVITNLVINPSKFITLCEAAFLTVEANDPDGDRLSFLWELLGTNQRSTNNPIRFSSFSTGTFPLRVTVTDTLGGKTSLTFSMHVSPCTDAGTD